MFPEGSGEIGSERFDPAFFLLQNHQATTFDDLKAHQFTKYCLYNGTERFDKLFLFRSEIKLYLLLFLFFFLLDIDISLTMSKHASWRLFKNKLKIGYSMLFILLCQPIHRAVGASSQCYWDELMLLKIELMQLKCQINTNMNNN